jgi:hypothetical protein
MSEEIPRYLPDRAFPPYAFIAGTGVPHPRRDPSGHSYHAPELAPKPLDPERWFDCSEYLYAADLFNHDYYWEAHEAWEGLWIAAGRKGTTAEFLKGLIKLAASGVKVWQQRPSGVRRHAIRAMEHFQRVLDETGAARYAGLELESAMALSRDMSERADSLTAWFDADSPVVFDRPLILGSDSP